MATNFPTSLDSLTNPNSTDQLNSPSHSAQHANANDAIEALESKVGITNSEVTTSHDYRITQVEALVNAAVSGSKSIVQDVRNQSGSSLTKGTPVYVSGSDGASGKMLISPASNSAESTSSKTMGLTSSTIGNNSNGQVISEGILEGIDTTGASDGDPVWLGTSGAKIFGLANKPYAPSHLVFLGVVIRGGQQNTGSMYVKIQNGFELEELHNVQITSPVNGAGIIYDATAGYWKDSDALATQTYVTNAVSGLGNTVDTNYVAVADVGQPDGVASLNSSGVIPDSQIPSGIARDSEVSSAISTEVTNRNSAISTAINNLINSAPGTLDTLGEIATQLASDESAASALTTTVNGKVSKAGGDIITSSLSSVIPVVLKGAASQTADLTQWQNSSGTTLARVSPTGNINTPAILSTNNYSSYFSFTDNQPIFANPLTAAHVALVIKGAASQTANLQEWQNSSGTVLAKVQPGGEIQSLGFISSYNSYFYAGTSGAIPLRTIGAVSQTADLQQWQNSAGSVLAKVDASGAGTFTGLTSNTSGLIYYDFYIGNQAYIYGAADYGSALNVITRGTAATGIIVRGRASQTADLQQWQNSAGSVVAKVDSSGIGTFAQGVFAGGAASIDGGGGATLGAIYTGSLKGSPTSYNFFSNVSGSPYATVVVKGLSGQTTDLQQWQNSSGTVLAKITSAGAFDATAITINGSPIASSNSSIITRKTITSTAGQTAFVTDVSFASGEEQVYLNGLLLVSTTDYTVSGGNTVTLTSAAAVNDIVEIITTSALSSTNTYTKSEADALLGSKLSSSVAASTYAPLASPTFSGTVGTGPIGITQSSNSAVYPVTISSANQQGGGAGYSDLIKLVNTKSGATNPNRFIRMSDSGSLEIVNSAYTATNMTLDNSGNAVFAGFVRGAAAGSVLKDTMLSNSEITVVSTSIATSTTATNFITYNYTPVSSSSYLIVHIHISKYANSGTVNDDYYSQLLVDGNEIAYGYVNYNTNSGGSGRTGTLFPLTGRYTNSSTTAKQIQVAARRASADDTITIDNSATAIWLRITEVAR